MSYILFCLLTIVANPPHVSHVAVHSYYLEDNQLCWKFLIEKDELLTFGMDNNCDINQKTALCTSRYLQKKSSIKVNGKVIEPKFKRTYDENGHLIIVLKANLPKSKIKSVEINNNCFYEFNKKFKNRIIVNIETIQTSYSLNRNRKKIKLKQ